MQRYILFMPLHFFFILNYKFYIKMKKYIKISLLFIFALLSFSMSYAQTLVAKDANNLSIVPPIANNKIIMLNNGKFATTTPELMWNNFFAPTKLAPILALYYQKTEVDAALSTKLSSAQIATTAQAGVMTAAKVQELANHSSLIGVGNIPAIPAGTFQKLTANKVVFAIAELEQNLIDSSAASRAALLASQVQDTAIQIVYPTQGEQVPLTAKTIFVGGTTTVTSIGVYPPYYPERFTVYRAPSYRGTINVIPDGAIQNLYSPISGFPAGLYADVSIDSTYSSVTFRRVGNDYYVDSYNRIGKYIDSSYVKTHGLSLRNLPAMPLSAQDKCLTWDQTDGWVPTSLPNYGLVINGNQLYIQDGTGSPSITLPSSGGSGVTSFAGRTGAITATKSDVGLANVDNTSDANKPISNATQAALDTKQVAIASGTTAQYFRGDKTWQSLNKAAVALSAVDNTSDANKPVSTAQAAAIALKANATHAHIIADVTGLQTALDTKQAILTAGTGIAISGSTISSTVAIPSAVGHANEILTNDGTTNYWTQPSILGYTTTSPNLIIINNNINLQITKYATQAAADAANLAANTLYGVLQADGGYNLRMK